MCRQALIAMGALLVASQGAAAQDWREMTSFRQRSGEGALDVQVRYGAGRLMIEPGAAGELYRVGIRYDSDQFEPIAAFREGTLEVGVEGSGNGIKLRNSEGGEMILSLARDVALDLDLDFGAVEADLELGGLHVQRLDIETGASDTEVRFSSPNPADCERFELSMGAAAFEATGLGNANCRLVRVEGGVGDMTLDFSGAWRRSVEAEVSMALGSLTLVVPEDIGVRIDKDTFLTDLGGRGLSKRDGVYYSDNWDRARWRLDVDLDGAFGSVDVRWTAPSLASTP